MLVAGILVLRTRRKRAALRATMPAAMTRRQLAFARKLFKLLERRASPQSPHQTVRQWAHESACRLGMAQEAVRELVDMYYSLRWGLRAMNEHQLQLAEQKVAALAADLSG